MESKLLFKRAKESEYQTFIYLEKIVSHNYTYSAILEIKEAKKEIKSNEVYFIYKDKQLVGSVEFCEKNKKGYVSGLVVDPKFQGQGIAKEAIKFVLKKMKDLKIIWLVTHPHNTNAIKIYLSFGFIIKGWKDNYFGDGQPRIVLEKTNILKKIR